MEYPHDAVWALHTDDDRGGVPTVPNKPPVQKHADFYLGAGARLRHALRCCAVPLYSLLEALRKEDFTVLDKTDSEAAEILRDTKVRDHTGAQLPRRAHSAHAAGCAEY